MLEAKMRRDVATIGKLPFQHNTARYTGSSTCSEPTNTYGVPIYKPHCHLSRRLLFVPQLEEAYNLLYDLDVGDPMDL